MTPDLRAELVDGVLNVTASGRWTLGVRAGAPRKGLAARFGRKGERDEGPAPAVVRAEAALKRALAGGSLKAVALRADNLAAWDSSLLAVLAGLAANAAAHDVPVRTEGLPEGMTRLLELSRAATPAKTQATPARREPGLLELVGGKTLALPGMVADVMAFLGETVAGMGRFFLGRAAFSRRDMWLALRECGVDALPIVSLTSLLLGLILAFVGAIQLRMFGADIYVAALVGVSMVRVMGPVLTGIVLAGRTGASFAAVIGSMRVNEEVDALATFGVAPVDFLVLPRVLSLAVMTPLLTVYADIMGIVGGFVVGVFMLDISPAAYWANTLTNIRTSYVWIGLLHALVFGFVVSLCGCYQGIRCGRSAEAVGRATTAAVVNAIVGIIVSTSIITVMFTVIDL